MGRAARLGWKHVLGRVFSLFSSLLALGRGRGHEKCVLFRGGCDFVPWHGLGHTRVVLQQQDTPVSIILVSIMRFLDLDTYIQGPCAFAGGRWRQ